jgi:hypothetical protein
MISRVEIMVCRVVVMMAPMGTRTLDQTADRPGVRATIVAAKTMQTIA